MEKPILIEMSSVEQLEAEIKKLEKERAGCISYDHESKRDCEYAIAGVQFAIPRVAVREAIIENLSQMSFEGVIGKEGAEAILKLLQEEC